MSDEIAIRQPESNLPRLTLTDESTSLTSLDRSTPEGAMAYYNAMIGEALSMRELVNTKINVKDAVIHHVERVDKVSGEIETGIRVALIATDGKVYHCQSGGVLKTLKIIAGTVGPLPWQKGREVVIKQRGLDEGKVWLYLELSQDEIARFMKEKRTK